MMTGGISSDGLVSALKWRYAVKKFDSTKKLSTEQWAALEETLILSPSSFGLQPWRFLVVTNPELRKQLTPASWGQSQISDCSHLVVFAQRTSMSTAEVDRFVDSMVSVRGVARDSLTEYRGMMVGFINSMNADAVKNWTAKQCYIALGNLMTAAAVLGVDVCPMEGIDPAKYNEILDVPKLGAYSTLVVAAVGFRSEQDGYAKAKKVRFPASEMIVHLK
jgi:nitroreductase